MQHPAEERELPFVIGVLADLSFDEETPRVPVKDRDFLSIDKDCFDNVIRRMESRIRFTAGAGKLAVKRIKAPIFLIDHDDMLDPVELPIRVMILSLPGADVKHG